ncbi:iron complex transport system ATP-binding protein [Salinimicrobium catena]|uniref:Iron complex transport system ATP-binding protein n=1 Tax=Salinimicrobium catena TaxID=390640 RepID=A0A1H5P391_9FLAO|nr:ABC transporter ATP-binding protein [Salinimicrobium catena]SDL67457.1 iron complex transport system ATP-binding protein [Salinimicrobium catena]SEF08329.1 iron complex transport system ATP-binding protein [Salinimicrobium catena]
MQKNVEQNIVLQTKDLQTGYRKKDRETVISSGIDVSVQERELVAVIGVNGVGKSTFLRTLSGIQPELGGKVLINGHDRKEISSEKLAALISLVLTEQPISKNLGVAELVALGRQPYTNWIGNLSAEDRGQVKKALQLVNIGDIQHKKCYELSDGQLQKVLIARALAQDTPIMILDEPTSHLDMYHKAQVLKLLKQLTDQTGKAILFATHEINLALELCDKIILMKPDGVIQGSPEELIQKRAFESIFPEDLIFFDPATRSFRIKS